MQLLSEAYPLEVINAGDFLDNQPDEPEWIVRPLCVKGSSIMLYGRQGVGKSSITMQLIHSITTGEPFLGFRVYRTGKVLYLQLDMAQQELRMVLDRAERADMNVRKDVYIPKIPEGEEAVLFNILDDAQAAMLTTLCEEIQPICVIVDTIHDAYEPDTKQTDINAQIRKIVRRFRKCIGSAALVFLNHTRKQTMMAASKKRTDEDDADDFMGGQAWAGLATTVLKLSRSKTDGALYLVLDKTRLEKWPEARLKLEESGHGFYKHEMDYKQMLVHWPDCLVPDEREAVLSRIKNKSFVFADIAARTGMSADVIRTHFYRNRGVDYGWLKLLEGE